MDKDLHRRDIIQQCFKAVPFLQSTEHVPELIGKVLYAFAECALHANRYTAEKGQATDIDNGCIRIIHRLSPVMATTKKRNNMSVNFHAFRDVDLDATEKTHDLYLGSWCGKTGQAIVQVGPAEYRYKFQSCRDDLFVVAVGA